MSIYTDASLIVTSNAKKAGKLYSLKGADLDVVRATTATYVGSDGLIKTALANEVRFDYTNGSCPSILVEPQRTNLLSRSEEFENAYWIKNNTSIIPNATISPSGLMNADKLVENNLLSEHNIQVFIGGTELRTNSIFVKAGERTRFILWAGASGCMFDLINLTTTPGNNASGITSTLIEDYGNGWYRCSIVSTLGRSNGYRITLMDNLTSPEATSPSYQGDGVSGLYIWGAQREDAANVTSYIPTTTSSVTRNADVISKSGIYTNGLITSDGGTMFIELKNNIPAIGSNFSDFSLGIGSTSNGYGGNGSLSLWNFTMGISRLQILKNVGGTYSILYTSTTDNCKIVIKWNGTTVDVFENGVKVVNASSFNITNMNFLYGNGLRRSFLLNKMFLFTTPLTDAQAIQLTTL